jgi:hypothetical protein
MMNSNPVFSGNPDAIKQSTLTGNFKSLIGQTAAERAVSPEDSEDSLDLQRIRVCCVSPLDSSPLDSPLDPLAESPR